MGRKNTQRELRNDRGRIKRALDNGKAFVVTLYTKNPEDFVGLTVFVDIRPSERHPSR